MLKMLTAKVNTQKGMLTLKGKVLPPVVRELKPTGTALSLVRDIRAVEPAPL